MFTKNPQRDKRIGQWIGGGVLFFIFTSCVSSSMPKSPEQAQADYDQDVKERTDYIMKEIRCKDLRQPGC